MQQSIRSERDGLDFATEHTHTTKGYYLHRTYYVPGTHKCFIDTAAFPNLLDQMNTGILDDLGFRKAMENLYPAGSREASITLLFLQ